ncbi:hypothetical protein PFISCL1PPCAC_21484, partial [Pristionchus fissidentatus]
MQNRVLTKAAPVHRVIFSDAHYDTLNLIATLGHTISTNLIDGGAQEVSTVATTVVASDQTARYDFSPSHTRFHRALISRNETNRVDRVGFGYVGTAAASMVHEPPPPDSYKMVSSVDLSNRKPRYQLK